MHILKIGCSWGLPSVSGAEPQRGPGMESLVGVRGAEPLVGVRGRSDLLCILSNSGSVVRKNR